MRVAALSPEVGRRAQPGESHARRAGRAPFTQRTVPVIPALIHPENRNGDLSRAGLEAAFRTWFTREVGTAKAYARLTGVSLALAEKRRQGALPDLAREGPALCAAFGDAWFLALMAPALNQYLEARRAELTRTINDQARWQQSLAGQGRRSAAHRTDPRAR